MRYLLLTTSANGTVTVSQYNLLETAYPAFEDAKATMMHPETNIKLLSCTIIADTARRK